MTTRETILFAGDSNCMGYQGGTVPSESYANIAHLHKMDGTYTFVSSGDPIVSGLGFGVGPINAFGDKWYDLRGVSDLEVGLVPLLGLHLTDWSMYDGSAAAYAVAIKGGLLAASTWGPIKGLVWSFGTNELTNPQFAEMHGIIRRMRMEFGATLPVIFNGLTPANSGSLVQGMITDMPNHLPALAVIDTSDLTANVGDSNHFDAASQVTIGHRGAAALLGLS